MRRNVLLVDDDATTLELVSFFLKHAGFVVKECKDGYSALDELQNHPYDLVILDISMPHINGIKALKKIRENSKTKDIPVMMLTSSKDKEDILEAKKNNVTDYIIKPPSRENFIKRIELIMGGRPQFEVIQLPENEKMAIGSFSLPLRLKSISRNGMVLVGAVPLEKDSTIKIDQLPLFEKLKLKPREFKINDCTLLKNKEFEYMISFLGLSSEEHESIRDWIMYESYRQKNNKSA